MTISGDESRDWKDALVDRVAAQWRWMILAVALLFAFNNLAGLVLGFTGLVAFANRLVGRLLKAQRVVRQVQGMVITIRSTYSVRQGQGSDPPAS